MKGLYIPNLRRVTTESMYGLNGCNGLINVRKCPFPKGEYKIC